MKENNAGETEGATGSESYQDEIYDIALFQAIMKAENYLKPFFTYDLDGNLFNRVGWRRMVVKMATKQP